MDIRDHIKAAIELLGSEAKLGKATGYSQHAIWKAKIHGKVSPEMALAIHRATAGAVSASALRPDLWPTPSNVPAQRVGASKADAADARMRCPMPKPRPRRRAA